MAVPSDFLQAGVQLFCLLAMGHFLADFALQSDRMAQEKCRGKDHTLPWQWWMLAHAAIHALIVSLITGVVWLGLAEWAVHMVIDDGKCRHRYSLGFDQMLHLICKMVWVLVMFANGWLGLTGMLRPI